MSTNKKRNPNSEQEAKTSMKQSNKKWLILLVWGIYEEIIRKNIMAAQSQLNIESKIWNRSTQLEKMVVALSSDWREELLYPPGPSLPEVPSSGSGPRCSSALASCNPEKAAAPEGSEPLSDSRAEKVHMAKLKTWSMSEAKLLLGFSKKKVA